MQRMIVTKWAIARTPQGLVRVPYCFHYIGPGKRSVLSLHKRLDHACSPAKSRHTPKHLRKAGHMEIEAAAA